MGRLFKEYVDAGTKYVCLGCGSDVASEGALIWEGFMGLQTPALLFRTTVNLAAPPACGERREQLSTGVYKLQDVACRACCAVLGWKYLEAERVDQAYKVGAVLLQQGCLGRVAAAAPDPCPQPRRILIT